MIELRSDVPPAGDVLDAEILDDASMRKRLPAHVRLLATTPSFDNCSRRELVGLASVGTVIDVAPGRVLWRVGELCLQMAIVVDGALLASAAEGTSRLLTKGDGCGWSPDGAGAVAVEGIEAIMATTLLVLGPTEVSAIRDIAPHAAIPSRLCSPSALATLMPAPPGQRRHSSIAT